MTKLFLQKLSQQHLRKCVTIIAFLMPENLTKVWKKSIFQKIHCSTSIKPIWQLRRTKKNSVVTISYVVRLLRSQHLHMTWALATWRKTKLKWFALDVIVRLENFPVSMTRSVISSSEASLSRCFSIMGLIKKSQKSCIRTTGEVWVLSVEPCLTGIRYELKIVRSMLNAQTSIFFCPSSQTGRRHKPVTKKYQHFSYWH